MFLLPIVLIVLLYVFLKDEQISWHGSRRKSAIDILDERLSKGELSIEEYRALKNELA